MCLRNNPWWFVCVWCSSIQWNDDDCYGGYGTVGVRRVGCVDTERARTHKLWVGQNEFLTRTVFSQWNAVANERDRQTGGQIERDRERQSESYRTADQNVVLPVLLSLRSARVYLMTALSFIVVVRIKTQRTHDDDVDDVENTNTSSLFYFSPLSLFFLSFFCHLNTANPNLLELTTKLHAHSFFHFSFFSELFDFFDFFAFSIRIDVYRESFEFTDKLATNFALCLKQNGSLGNGFRWVLDYLLNEIEELVRWKWAFACGQCTWKKLLHTFACSTQFNSELKMVSMQTHTRTLVMCLPYTKPLPFS